jgi:hypothetical protein
MQGLQRIKLKSKAPMECSSIARRLKFYGTFVRKITYSKKKRLHPQTLAFLNEGTEFPNPLFPNATDVILPCSSARFLESVFYPPVVLSPAVRSVTVFTDEIKVKPTTSTLNAGQLSAIVLTASCPLFAHSKWTKAS